MVGLTTGATLAVAAGASLFMAWAIGAGSSGSTPFAPAVGANAVSIMRASFVVGILGFLGAVLQGANVTQTVGAGLVRFPEGGALSAVPAIVALVTAAVLVAVGVFLGYPIATAFTVTGAVIGAGLASGGLPAYGTYAEILALWLAVPVVGGTVAYATARLLRHESVPPRVGVPALGAVVGVILANVEFVLLAAGEAQASIGTALAAAAGTPGLPTRVVTSAGLAAVAGALLSREVAADAATGQRRFLLVMGGLVAFSAGGSQVGLAIGPLMPLLGPETGVVLPIVAVLVFGGAGLLIGSWTGAPRMIKALSQDYSSLGPRRSIAALIPAFAIAQTAVFFGIPVSFNEIIVSAIVGSGAAAGGEVSGEKLGKTALAWVASLVGAFALTYGIVAAVGLA